MKSIVKTMVPAVLLAFVLIGCAGGPSEDKPIAEIKKEAEGMSAVQLEAMVKKYEAVIKSKSSEIEAITAKIKKIPIKELMGDDAKALKANVEEVTKSLKALKDRLSVYAQAMKAEMQNAAK